MEKKPGSKMLEKIFDGKKEAKLGTERGRLLSMCKQKKG